MATGVSQRYFDAIYNRIVSSTALANALDGGEVAANHVALRRFRRGAEVPSHTQLIQHGPMIYVWPGYTVWKSLTAQDQKSDDSTVNCTICQVVDTSTVLEFTDSLIRELMGAADGTGGLQSFLSGIGFNLRVRVETPDQEGHASNPETSQVIVFTCCIEQDKVYP